MDIRAINSYLSYMNSASLFQSRGVEGSTDSLLSGSLLNGIGSYNQNFSTVLSGIMNQTSDLDQSIISSQLSDCVKDQCTCRSSEFTRSLYEYYQNKDYPYNVINDYTKSTGSSTDSAGTSRTPAVSAAQASSIPSAMDPLSIKSQIESSIQKSISL